MNASVQSVSSDFSSLFNSLFTVEEKDALLSLIHYNEICYLSVSFHYCYTGLHPFHYLQLILAKPVQQRICKYMKKKKNYFSFIQALLCTLVSTKRVCNCVQFFYFMKSSTLTLLF